MASGTINKLIAVVKDSKGFQHANYFTYTCPAKNLRDDTNEYTILSTSLPGRTLSTGEHSPGTVTKKFVYSFIDEDIQIVYRLTNDFSIYDKWQDWMAQVVQAEKYTVGYKDEYAADSFVSSLDKNMGVTKMFRLINSYPIIITPIELNNDSENTIATFGVTLTFDRYETVG